MSMNDRQYLGWADLRQVDVLLATVGGSGLVKPAPGTWGSVVTAAVIALLAVAGTPYLQPMLLLAAGILTVVGLWVTRRIQHRYGLGDPGEVVIDEAAGLTLAVALVPEWLVHDRPLLVCFLAFLWFRLFDICKPWPIAALDRLPGAVGVMVDDLGAGVVAGILTIACIS
jgi:phosphatidylglycerophosphatase A